ncbi:hypothetical protein P152DRAFT_458571 [Eremomyces bilateralis CBS 781.70]|uniref:Putative gamma-glutamylcyclotransferase n=1 Tax=Eremomyces bilateralis CBS 781.70 TaxID=1392243 RepID=A0A6G1G281_9PEZI|nr:uncharacterized protein P152DRAFT_458571 [Eremomyces bilateralis CBS 781.70]KAF1812164.1 hypothetical protein P152DRAFT_458571 [Eremomyces bilateralis CBS 781.70]
MTVLYFFYGSLQDPAQIRGVLDLPEAHGIILRPARISGYNIKLWGPYPALIRDEPSRNEDTTDEQSKAYVDGSVFEVRSDKHEAQFQYYETRNYTPHWVQIEVGTGVGVQSDEAYETIAGKTFVWNGAASDLQDGTFDLQDFLRQKARWFKTLNDEVEEGEINCKPVVMEIRENIHADIHRETFDD